MGGAVARTVQRCVDALAAWWLAQLLSFWAIDLGFFSAGALDLRRSCGLLTPPLASAGAGLPESAGTSEWHAARRPWCTRGRASLRPGRWWSESRRIVTHAALPRRGGHSAVSGESISGGLRT